MERQGCISEIVSASLGFFRFVEGFSRAGSTEQVTEIDHQANPQGNDLGEHGIRADFCRFENKTAVLV